MREAKCAVRDETGTSLMEIMVGLVLMSMVLLGVAQIIPTGMSGVTSGRVHTKAMQACQKQLETLRALDFSAGALTSGTYSDTTGVYVVTWTITDDRPVAGGKEVNITASWSSPTGAQSVSLDSYLVD